MFSFLQKGSAATQIKTRLNQSRFVDSIVTRHLTSKASLPQGPKKPSCSSYVRYVESEFENFQKKNPFLNSKQVMKGLGVQWQCLDAEKKREYLDSQKETYEARKKEYEKAHADFMSNLTEEQKRIMDSRIQQRRIARFKRAVQSIENALEKPRRVPSTTALYLQSISELNPNSKTILADVVTKWKSLSSDEKEKYYSMRSDKVKEYQTKMEVYQRRLEENEETRRKLEKLRSKVAELQKQATSL